MKMSREEKERRKQKIRERIQIKMEQDNYEFFPGEDSPSIKDIHEREMRVAVYARVSTDNAEQTTSIELQKKYYEEFVNNHPNWKLVAIYADDGKSGTSDEHRDGFRINLQLAFIVNVIAKQLRNQRKTMVKSHTE